MVGNYFWVQLDRDRAASYYARVDNNFPGSTDAPAANWRVAWRSYLEHRPETLQLLELHLERYPSSPFITDDLYWLARVSEAAGNTNVARACYQKLIDRYPRTYFGGLAVARLKNLGPGYSEPLDALSKIPPLAPARPVGLIPAAAAARQSRANALRTIAFDSSAELELRAAYAATGEPRLLLEASQAAADAGHYGIAISTARQVIPSLESRRFDDVPREVWKAAYPLPYEKQLRDAAGRAVVDPMVVAGLIRQESAYETNAISHANAYGLMQLLPKTARLLARQERVGYSRPRLTDPGYNLRLGTVYLAGLVKFWGSFEAALAAYNAGEDRVGSWRSGQSYAEPAEFVDSIPFTETREYVQIVLRNAETYRTLYGHATPAGNTKSSEGHK
jgi:soluble lytic murein transglycosylase